MISKDEILGGLAREEWLRAPGLRPSHFSRPSGTALLLSCPTHDFHPGPLSAVAAGLFRCGEEAR
jgi:hypothetical protein